MAGIRVRGLRESVRSLERYGVEVADLKDVLFPAGELVAADARTRVNSRSGRLAGSIRASKAKSRVTIRSGGARIPYAEVIHWGWPAHNIEPQEYLTRAVEERQDEALEIVRDGLQALAARLDLD